MKAKTKTNRKSNEKQKPQKKANGPARRSERNGKSNKGAPSKGPWRAPEAAVCAKCASSIQSQAWARACVRSAGRRKRSESALGRLAAGRKPAGPRSLSSADARPFGPALGRPQAGPFDRRVRAGWRRPVRRHGLGGKRRSASSPKAANPSSRSARRRSASQNEIRVSPAAPNRRPRPTRATGCGGGLLSPGAAPGRRPAGGLAGVSAFGPFGR